MHYIFFFFLHFSHASVDSDMPMAHQASEDPDLINTAVFYSITSTQRGLTVRKISMSMLT